MSGYYSFVVFNPQSFAVGFRDPLLVLDQGVDSFSTFVRDEADFLRQLEEAGIQIKQMHRLDGQDGKPELSP